MNINSFGNELSILKKKYEAFDEGKLPLNSTSHSVGHTELYLY